ncbi:hypothetical protein K469DRAFT_692614 [Zopfia rhizophila CBS 207.26]|uniref:Uncharacterized protein n=1 Tax=Zopfia rhizophila CBS 207.26 TaxID=1314779 RepID=A0A6A6DQW8_9PEZI|nr:hypothetical protein K469DRAFT_692614 [Zopfia rhizophila CBS 207.26]
MGSTYYHIPDLYETLGLSRPESFFDRSTDVFDIDPGSTLESLNSNAINQADRDMSQVTNKGFISEGFVGTAEVEEVNAESPMAHIQSYLNVKKTMTPAKASAENEQISRQSVRYDDHLTMSRKVPLNAPIEDESIAGQDANQHDSLEMSKESVMGPSEHGRIQAPAATPDEGENAITQDVPPITSSESSLNVQHEAMCTPQPADVETSEAMLDHPTEKGKGETAHDAVEPRLDDRIGLHAGEIEEGTSLGLDPGSPPVMLPVMDETPRTETTQAEDEQVIRLTAFLLYVFSTSARQDRTASPASQNGESIQERVPSTDKISEEATHNGDLPENAPDVEMSEVHGRVEETCRPSDQSNPAGSSRDNPILLDDDETTGLPFYENGQEQSRRPSHGSYTDATDAEDEWNGLSIQPLSRSVSRNKRKRKLESRIPWANVEFQQQAAFELDSAWQTTMISWMEISPFIKRITGDDSEFNTAIMHFKERIRRMCHDTKDKEKVDLGIVLEFNSCWKEVVEKVRGMKCLRNEREKVKLWKFSRVLGQLAERAALYDCIQEYPDSMDRKDEEKDGDYDDDVKARCRFKIRRR